MANTQSKFENRSIAIPDTVRVKCPAVGGKLRTVPKCIACAHHAGFSEQLFNPRLRVAQRFVVKCTFATERQLFEVEDAA